MKTNFNMIMIIKVQNLLTSIKNYYNISYQESIKELYNSKLYQLLEEEDTKMWYFSSEQLFKMLIEEKETGNYIV